jgi:hypothetical protein
LCLASDENDELAVIKVIGNYVKKPSGFFGGRSICYGRDQRILMRHEKIKKKIYWCIVDKWCFEVCMINAEGACVK